MAEAAVQSEEGVSGDNGERCYGMFKKRKKIYKASLRMFLVNLDHGKQNDL